MCGILGCFDSKTTISKKILKPMIERLSHRGPDNLEIFIDTNLNVGLGHTRLSIVDLSQ